MNEIESTIINSTSTSATADVDVVAVAVGRFAQKLRAARRHGGDPSLREMASTIGNQPARTGLRQVSAATLGRALTGEKLPKWWVVEGLLIACHADRTTTVYRKVRKAWLEVAELIDPIGVDADEFAEDDDESDVVPVHLALVRDHELTFPDHRRTGS